MKRVYGYAIRDHCRENQQMVFLTGPRQVGKTHTATHLYPDYRYFNWDNQAHRREILAGPRRIAELCNLQRIQAGKVRIVFDEIHKYSRWKNFLKGFYDSFHDQVSIIVTGSSRMNIFKRGGDSLMGRYFLYRMHPLTVGELRSQKENLGLIRPPGSLRPGLWEALLEFGGFPEPFLKRNRRFTNRWKRLRREQFFREDLRDLSRIQEIGQVEVMAQLLQESAGQLLNYSTLSSAINVSVDTIRRWLETLKAMYFCFTITPWFKNVPKSLRKQPRVFLYDWSGIQNPGARNENLVASHLYKAVQWWTDIGLGDFALHYVRDKLKREVDFLITRENVPWILVETKTSAHKGISPNLKYYHNLLKVPHAFQVAVHADFIDRDCFAHHDPVIVPAATFLSQLV